MHNIPFLYFSFVKLREVRCNRQPCHWPDGIESKASYLKKLHFHCEKETEIKGAVNTRKEDDLPRCHIEFHLGIHFHVQMTFFVFLVAGILHSSGNLSYLSGRGGLSSGKMKFLVQFAIRCECKRPLALLDIEKEEGQVDVNETREIERLEK